MAVDQDINAPEGAPQAPEPDKSEMRALLQTPWDSVFSLSADGRTYTAPDMMRGTPVLKIDESSPYWESDWATVDAFLDQEAEEEELKRQSRARLDLDPDNKRFKDAHKLHQDNVSKHRKVREIFGNTSQYHPNQIVAKKHLPPGGICQKELMYRLACKISDLRVLRGCGELAMDPWDFIRWRVARKARKVMGPAHALTNVKENIRSIITKIFEEDNASNPYGDSLMRYAVLRSAELQGRLASFGSRRKGNQFKATSNTTNGHRARRTAAAPLQVSGAQRRSSLPELSRIESDSLAARRRPRRISPPSEYQGVNAFRKRKQQTGAA